MPRRSVLFAIILLCPLLAGKKQPQKIADGRAENNIAALDATIYADPEAVQQIVGNDLQGHYIVVKVRLAPKSGPITIDRDDFLLRTDKDGERAHPFVATQIAGEGVLVISETATGGGGTRSGGNPRGPVWGIPGTMGGGGVGNAATTTGSTAKMEKSDKKDPLVDVLAAKMLPEQQIEKPTEGLLYFPMEKQKLKDLELSYATSAGKLSVRFK